jgi:hypothetical protein
MPQANLKAIKQQLEKWASASTIVMLAFSNPALSFELFGTVLYAKGGLSFEVRTAGKCYGFGYFHSPRLSSFNVVSLAPDTNFGNALTMTLKRRRKGKIQMLLQLVETTKTALTAVNPEELKKVYGERSRKWVH